MRTEKELNEARRYAAQIPIECAIEAKNDPDFLAKHLTDNDRKEYINRMELKAARIIAGELDSNFTIWQRMNLFFTGEMVALFPDQPNNELR